jgi:hypothetical protein
MEMSQCIPYVDLLYANKRQKVKGLAQQRLSLKSLL